MVVRAAGSPVVGLVGLTMFAKDRSFRFHMSIGFAKEKCSGSSCRRPCVPTIIAAQAVFPPPHHSKRSRPTVPQGIFTKSSKVAGRGPFYTTNQKKKKIDGRGAVTVSVS